MNLAPLNPQINQKILSMQTNQINQNNSNANNIISNNQN